MKTKRQSSWPKTLLLVGGIFFFTVFVLNSQRNKQVWAASNPFLGAKWYIDPNSSAKKQADAWRASRPADATQMDKIAKQPQADWFGDWNTDVQTSVDQRISTITATGALPVLVAYNIPKRDCNSYSAGGATSPDNYRKWISAFTNGTRSRKVVVVLEPDALAQLGCLNSTDQQTRLTLIGEAIKTIKTNPNAAVYVDAGHSGWISDTEMADRLNKSNIALADGFSTNVSNFKSRSDELIYAKNLSSRIGGKHFIIDTSRNGLGPTPDNQWCNPSGRALGYRPTTATGEALADAYFWIKRPGQSDGTCNSGPTAGIWWPEYALGLAQRAAY